MIAATAMFAAFDGLPAFGAAGAWPFNGAGGFALGPGAVGTIGGGGVGGGAIPARD
jgi:hypothetical protein